MLRARWARLRQPAAGSRKRDSAQWAASNRPSGSWPARRRAPWCGSSSRTPRPKTLPSWPPTARPSPARSTASPTPAARRPSPCGLNSRFGPIRGAGAPSSERRESREGKGRRERPAYLRSERTGAAAPTAVRRPPWGGRGSAGTWGPFASPGRRAGRIRPTSSSRTSCISRHGTCRYLPSSLPDTHEGIRRPTHHQVAPDVARPGTCAPG